MKRNLPWLIALSLATMPAHRRFARAANEVEAPTVPTVQLSVYPRSEPEYAMQYLLEVPYMEQRPGNGALYYERALSLVTKISGEYPDFNADTLSAWVGSPLDKLPLAKVRQAVSVFEPALHHLDLAGRRERCTWEYPIREEGFRTEWPVLGGFRTLTRVLRLKARLQMADGETEQAVDTLTIGMSAARDLGQGPLVVQNLVGIAIAANMVKEAALMIEHPQAPNLYWALTALPRPLVDMRRSLQMEAGILYAELPELKALERTPLSNEEVIAIWNKAMSLLSLTDDRPDTWTARLATAGGALKVYPEAQRHLLERGRTVEEVEALPALYVVLLYQHDHYRRVRDAIHKWHALPYWKAKDGLAKAERLFGDTLSGSYNRMDGITSAFLNTLPAFGRIGLLQTRLERDIAMLRCVEAIRLHAAEHDGRLPRILDEIAEVPVPLDPLYGRPFGYRLSGRKAMLESPPPPDGGPRDGLRYEITIKRAAR